ncbi:MAG: hypothetical protein NVS4B5_18730 [Vulcanimicrobiaceae bacterium]
MRLIHTCCTASPRRASTTKKPSREPSGTATSLGLASAFCSWTRGLSFQKDMVALLGVPDGFKPFTSLVVGNPVRPLRASEKARRAFDDAVSWV